MNEITYENKPYTAEVAEAVEIKKCLDKLTEKCSVKIHIGGNLVVCVDKSRRIFPTYFEGDTLSRSLQMAVKSMRDSKSE